MVCELLSCRGTLPFAHSHIHIPTHGLKHGVSGTFMVRHLNPKSSRALLIRNLKLYGRFQSGLKVLKHTRRHRTAAHCAAVMVMVMVASPWTSHGRGPTCGPTPDRMPDGRTPRSATRATRHARGLNISTSLWPLFSPRRRRTGLVLKLELKGLYGDRWGPNPLDGWCL